MKSRPARSLPAFTSCVTSINAAATDDRMPMVAGVRRGDDTRDQQDHVTRSNHTQGVEN